MSHFSKIKTTLKDLELLKKSLHDLGIIYSDKINNFTEHTFQNKFANLVITQSNDYDIDFTWNGTEYQLITDLHFWQQPWPVDVFLDTLSQRYAYNSILKVTKHQGFQLVEETTQKNGCICITLQRWT